MLRKSLIKAVNIILDLLLKNNFVMNYYKFKNKFITPKLDEMKGKAISSLIKNKGKDLRCHGLMDIMGLQDLHIGDYVRIGKGAYFSCKGGLYIGDNVQLSKNILIYTNTHDVNSTIIPYDRSYIHKPVHIGNSVWIGMNVTIAPGTRIGDGAVIGMGAVVSGDIPKGAIVVGSKHRIIGYRDLDEFDKKDSEKKYYGLLYPDN